MPQTTAPTPTATSTAETPAPVEGTPPVRARHHDIDTDVEELAAAAAAAPAGQAADLRERMVLAALPLADAIALRYAGRGIETDDLLQVARTALVKAVLTGTAPAPAPGSPPTPPRRSPGRSSAGSATTAGRCAHPGGSRSCGPRSVTEEERLRHHLARDPHDTETRRRPHRHHRRRRRGPLRSAGYHATSLDAPTPAGTPLADHLLTTDCPTTTIDLHDALRQAITHLTDRERLVLRLRFVDELTQTQIGDRIGVSQMQVSRILRTTLTRLRTHLQDTDTTPHTHTPAA